MTEHGAFLAAIRDAPDDDLPRLIYADWLEERGDSYAQQRGEFIRAQCELARLPVGHARRATLIRRLDAIRTTHAERWRAELPELSGVTWGPFERGFVGTVWVDSVKTFRKHAADIFAAAPIAAVVPRGGDFDTFRQLVHTPEAAYLRYLTLVFSNHNRLELESILESPYLTGLTALELAGTPLGLVGARALARLPLLSQLTRLELSSCSLLDEGNTTLIRSPHLTSLRILGLQANGLTANGINALADAPNLAGLRRLTLAGDPLGVAGVAALARSAFWDSLTHLGMTDVALTNAAVAKLSQGEQPCALRSLGLASNLIGGAGIQSILKSERLIGLEALRLQNNRAHTLSGTVLAAASPARNLRVLHLDGNPLGNDVAALAGCPRLAGLEALWLGNVKVGDRGAAALATSPNLANLTTLWLRQNKVGTAGARALASARFADRLDVLSLAANRVSDLGAIALLDSSIGRHANLLDLADNPISSGVHDRLEQRQVHPRPAASPGDASP